VINVFVRQIVGWQVSATARMDFALDALEQVPCECCPAGENALIHQSELHVYLLEQLNEDGIEPSVVPSATPRTMRPHGHMSQAKEALKFLERFRSNSDVGCKKFADYNTAQICIKAIADRLSNAIGMKVIFSRTIVYASPTSEG
jgi:hypothetical protein